MSAPERPLIDRPERIGAAAYLELLLNLTRREVKGRYSQSLFGFGWAVAQPVATMLVFTLVFSRLANILADVPYPVFAYAGLVPWFFFLNSVNSGTMSLVQYRNIVTKTYFPREIIPLAQVASRLLDFGAAALFVAGLIAINALLANAGRPLPVVGQYLPGGLYIALLFGLLALSNFQEMQQVKAFTRTWDYERRDPWERDPDYWKK